MSNKWIETPDSKLYHKLYEEFFDIAYDILTDIIFFEQIFGMDQIDCLKIPKYERKQIIQYFKEQSNG